MSVKLHRQKIQAQDSNVPIILVVEDEPDNLLFISHTLILFGHNFVTATSGQAAIDILSKYYIDLILIDLVLPDINGFELVNWIEQNKSTQNIPIIAISALVREEDRERAMKAGCDDYLIKPYLIDDLDRKIRRYLSKNFFSTNIFQKNKGLAMPNPA
ncbi:MAG: response regulator [Xenococcaceae cyanobacterium]